MEDIVIIFLGKTINSKLPENVKLFSQNRDEGVCPVQGASEPVNVHFQFPNAFDPHEDSLNDKFKAIGQPDNLTSFSMKIFNRWGQMVFETKDVLQGWDGMIKGAQAPAGTYVYRVEYSISGAEFSGTGTVVLVR